VFECCSQKTVEVEGSKIKTEVIQNSKENNGE